MQTGPMTAEQLALLRARNARRVKRLIHKMGPLYVCHPANRVQRAPVRSPGLLRLPARENH